MVVINNLLQRAHHHRSPPNIIHLRPLILILLLARRLGLHALLVVNKFLFQKQVVFYTIHLEQTKPTPCSGVYGGKLGGGCRSAPFLLPNTSRERWLPFLLWWLSFFVLVILTLGMA